MGETNEECEERVEERSNTQAHDTWMVVTRTNTLRQCRVRHYHACGQTRENVTCESVLFTLAVGCSRLPSAVNDLATTNSKIIMSSTCFHSTATMRYWMKKTTNATFGIDEERLVHVVLLQILVGDGS